ncbi:hypothetical protein [Amycolatopsis australiensis]|uniref:Uncharacterized protein n=1 Tax=Amycolatopsis australiensis TaxID=546364 RepID=A0A1K1SBA1_9PSEU|nr:hypothetical protein [Amycolatopsis australiensis]SFW81582.1 hypothetical protein SAMN04489730_5231 [Amycolatopsis australiensis]
MTVPVPVLPLAEPSGISEPMPVARFESRGLAAAPRQELMFIGAGLAGKAAHVH